MAENVNVDKIQIEISTNVQKAIKDLDSVASVLGNLENKANRISKATEKLNSVINKTSKKSNLESSAKGMDTIIDKMHQMVVYGEDLQRTFAMVKELMDRIFASTNMNWAYGTPVGGTQITPYQGMSAETIVDADFREIQRPLLIGMEKVTEESQKSEGVIQRLVKDFKTLSDSADRVGNSVGNIQKKSSRTSTFLAKLAGQFSRILTYRIIRNIIGAIGEGISKGVQNVYAFDSLRNGKYAQALDAIATANEQFKNTIGVLSSQIVQIFAPAIERVLIALSTGISYISKLIALAQGEGKYLAANTVKVKAYTSAINNLTAGIDELHILNGDNSGSASVGSLFRDEEIGQLTEKETEFKLLIDKIKTGLGKGEFDINSLSTSLTKSAQAGGIFGLAFGGIVGGLLGATLGIGVELLLQKFLPEKIGSMDKEEFISLLRDAIRDIGIAAVFLKFDKTAGLYIAVGLGIQLLYTHFLQEKLQSAGINTTILEGILNAAGLAVCSGALVFKLSKNAGSAMAAASLSLAFYFLYKKFNQLDKSSGISTTALATLLSEAVIGLAFGTLVFKATGGNYMAAALATTLSINIMDILVDIKKDIMKSKIEEALNNGDLGVTTNMMGVTMTVPTDYLADYYEVDKSKITRRATGGFVGQGQMFIAREAGAELVGNIGGRTAVANNDQIVSAVSDGVYRAVMSAMSNGSKQDNSFNIYLDGKQIEASVRKTAQRRGASIGVGGIVNGSYA